jgi:hypothetical protein
MPSEEAPIFVLADGANMYAYIFTRVLKSYKNRSKDDNNDNNDDVMVARKEFTWLLMFWNGV